MMVVCRVQALFHKAYLSTVHSIVLRSVQVVLHEVQWWSLASHQYDLYVYRALCVKVCASFEGKVDQLLAGVCGLTLRFLFSTHESCCHLMGDIFLHMLILLMLGTDITHVEIGILHFLQLFGKKKRLDSIHLIVKPSEINESKYSCYSYVHFC